MIDISLDPGRDASPKRPAKPSLELTRPVNADLQKQIDADVKTIRFAIAGNMRARNLFFAYAAIAGARANHLMEIAPHGEGEKILAAEFPESKQTLYNWRRFAAAVHEKLASETDSKSKTVLLLTSPSLGKKNIPAKAAEVVQAAVLEVMDGAGMMEFMRASKALKEEGLRGGDRGGNHAPRIPNAEEQREAAETLIAQYTSDIASMCSDKINLSLCSRPKLDALAEAALALRKQIEEIKSERKTK